VASAVVVSLIAGAGALVGCQKLGTPASGQEIAPALALPTADGGVFDPAALAGKPALVMFWSTTCGTCLDELPEIQKVADQGDCEVVTVVVKGAADQAEVVAQQLGVRVPVLIDEGRQFRSTLGLEGTPTTYALDAQGRATRYVVGGYGYERLSRLCDG